jgi:hypothetical protein
MHSVWVPLQLPPSTTLWPISIRCTYSALRGGVYLSVTCRIQAKVARGGMQGKPAMARAQKEGGGGGGAGGRGERNKASESYFNGRKVLRGEQGE